MTTTDLWLSTGRWDRLAASSFYSSSGWLRLCAAASGVEPEIAVAGDGTGGVPLTAVPVPLRGPYAWADVLAAAGLPKPAATGVMIGASQGGQTEFLGSREAIPEIVEQARARACGEACVAMYLSTEDAAATGALPVFLGLDAWLEIPPGGFEDWLRTLPSKRRVAIRGEVRRFDAAGYLLEDVPLGACGDRIAALAAATDGKYGHTAPIDAHVAIFRRQAAVFGDAARVTLCVAADGSPVGYCLYYVWGDTLYLRGTGYDYPRLAGAAEYFNVVYYAQIRRAEELGVRRIQAGLKASEAKALRGAALRPLWFVDLSVDTPLANAEAAVRAHNLAAYRRLTAEPRIAGALVAPDAWLQWC